MRRLEADAPGWRNTNFMSPEEFHWLLAALLRQEQLVALCEQELEVLAEEWDESLRLCHEEAVVVVRVVRACFHGKPAFHIWRKLKARGDSRARIAKEGLTIEMAWKTMDAAWSPRRGLTLGSFRARRKAAEAKGEEHVEAQHAVLSERGALWADADALYDLCVQWYTLATACFRAATPEGKLVRKVPTNYDLKPGKAPWPPEPDEPAVAAALPAKPATAA
jgi:hypothetical protein